MHYLVAALVLIGGLGVCLAQPTVGLLCHDSVRAFPGYTLIAPEPSRITYLIDNEGRVVHTWESAYPPGKAALLRPDGTLVRTATQISQWMLGGGAGGLVEMFDWSGSKSWAYTYLTPTSRLHHDVESLPNGNVLLLVRESHTRDYALRQGRLPARLTENALWSERIIEVKPTGPTTGEIVWSWSVMDHLIQEVDSTKPNFGVVKDHPERVNINIGHTRADWLHANSVRYNSVRDEVMISIRDLDEIWIISKRTGDIVFRYGNPQNYNMGTPIDQVLFGQHDARWQDGDTTRIMVFNNGRGRPGGNASSVDEIVLPLNPDGTYHRADGQPFMAAESKMVYPSTLSTLEFAGRSSGAERLPNGNTLICFGPDGVFIEINPVGEEVWKFVSPVSRVYPAKQAGARRNPVFRIQRYPVDYPAFKGKSLVPAEKLGE